MIKPHEHGEPFTLDRRDAKTSEAFQQIFNLHTRSTEWIAVAILALRATSKFTFPCRQCMLDTAIDFRDIAALIEELAGEKVKVK